MRTVGVEEELLLVSATTGEPLAVSSEVLAGAAGDGDGDGDEETPGGFEKELFQEQLEFATSPVHDMGKLREEIVRKRAEAARHAKGAGARIAALATSPLPVEPSRQVGPRYQWLAEQFALTTQEQLTCGCHVHVSVESDEEGVAVLDRVRPWLPLLNAISGNSPFWDGQDSGYSSYRSRVWNRWPSAGPYEVFGSPENYHAQVRDMVESGVLRDRGMIYFDARLSDNYPTVEFRVADVCLEAGTTVLVATLARALTETAARAWRDGEPPARVPVALMRLASWRAARSGLQGPLLDPRTLREVPAEAAFDALLEHTDAALRESGDRDAAHRALNDLLTRGGGAQRQRELRDAGCDLGEIVRECVRITAGEDA